MNQPRKRILLTFTILLLAGGAAAVGANDTYTYTGKWFGFVTDSMDLAKGHNITPEAVKAAVAQHGAKYVLINGIFWGQRFLALNPQEKAAEFAGQQVFVYGAMKTNSLTKATTYITDSDSGTGRVPWSITISKIEPHADDSLY